MPRVTKKETARSASVDKNRRITKSDGRFADYSSLKAATGIVIPEVKKVMLDRKKTERASTVRRGMYPSEMSLSDWCPRATYYRMSGLPEPQTKYSFSLENVFAQGNAVHEKWQTWLSETGKLWGDWKCSRCAAHVKNSLKPTEFYGGSCIGTDWVKFEELVTRHKGEAPRSIINDFAHDWRYREVTLKSTTLPLSGHADAGLVDHNVLVELKSISAGSFRYSAPKLFESHTHDLSGRKISDTDGMWKDFHAPLTSHLKQANLYLFMSNEMNLPFDRISFVYEYKANNQAKEFVVPYTYSIIEPILDTAHLVVDSLAKGNPPPCPKGGCASCKAYEVK
jgi:CRISPR/Cas system-associated exonuclease Cas4 (RecB family)